MSGGRRQAQPAGGRPLDEGVRRLAVDAIPASGGDLVPEAPHGASTFLFNEYVVSGSAECQIALEIGAIAFGRLAVSSRRAVHGRRGFLDLAHAVVASVASAIPLDQETKLKLVGASIRDRELAKMATVANECAVREDCWRCGEAKALRQANDQRKH